MPFCHVAAISERIAVLFLLGTNVAGSMRQKKNFAFRQLYTLFIFSNHIELDFSFPCGKHTVLFFSLENIALMQLLSFPPRDLPSVFPSDLTLKTSGEL